MVKTGAAREYASTIGTAIVRNRGMGGRLPGGGNTGTAINRLAARGNLSLTRGTARNLRAGGFSAPAGGGPSKAAVKRMRQAARGAFPNTTAGRARTRRPRPARG